MSIFINTVYARMYIKELECNLFIYLKTQTSTIEMYELMHEHNFSDHRI